MTFALRPYQEAACDAAMAWVRASTEPCLIDAAPAAGKSFMIAKVAADLHAISGGKRVLCLAPSAELVKQNHAKYLLTGERASIYSASAGAKSTKHVVVFGTPGTVKNSISRFMQNYAGVIVDECFAAGTMIQTPYGEKSIETLRTGDIVCNTVGSGQVETVFTKSVTEIYNVKLSNGETIECTGSHPFFTERGWIEVRNLMEGEVAFRREDVSRLLSHFRTQNGSAEGEAQAERSVGKVVEKTRNLFSILRKEMAEPYAQRFVAGKNASDAETHRTQTASDLGERSRSDSSAAGTFRCSGGRLDCRASNSDRNGPQERHLSERIQGRSSVPHEDDCYRSGRGESWHPSETSGGQEERQSLGSIRVESVSRIELTRPEIVYNLHVSGHPSYFAGGVLVHNCHGITPTIRDIIDAMREGNPRLRVLGLSGTPFRLGTGYVFRLWPDGHANGDDKARDPYFMKCVYRVSAREMLDQGFITPMTIGAINAAAYDTSGVVVKANGQLDHETVERAFEGHGRETAGAVADVVAQARHRPGGVMYFAATVRHAHEILASLPPDNSALVTGDECIMRGAPASRNAVISAYRARKVQHLVSVGTLTTGFDVEHTETIALLRYTESAALLQQILGRAWRLCAGKPDSLLLDYAGNVERHFPDGDIYNPDIKAGKGGGDGGRIDVKCPQCAAMNAFTLNMEYAEYQRNEYGYCLDQWGAQIETDYGPMPAHYGRRCFGQVKTGPNGEHDRCTYRWTGKECPECGELNDIAARYCYVCKAEIVNPNDRLIAEFKAMKRDPTRPQTDTVTGMTIKDGISARGNRTLRVDWVTPYRQFSTWFQPEGTHSRAVREYAAFMAATDNGNHPPGTVSYMKDDSSGFFRVLAYDREADAEPVADIVARRAA